MKRSRTILLSSTGAVLGCLACFVDRGYGIAVSQPISKRARLQAMLNRTTAA
jgi:hypothetical protein